MNSAQTAPCTVRDSGGVGKGPSQIASCLGEREGQWGGRENDKRETKKDYPQGQGTDFTGGSGPFRRP